MKIVFLGTGSKFGVPNILCDCRTCKRARKDAKLMRSRTSIFFKHHGTALLFDASPDLRIQALLNKIDLTELDGIFITHAHVDHFIGLAELFYTDIALTCYYHKSFCTDPIFQHTKELVETTSQVSFQEVTIDKEIRFRDITVTALQVEHSIIENAGITLAYEVASRCKSLVYAPDIATIDVPFLERLKKALIIIIDGSYMHKLKNMHLSISYAQRKLANVDGRVYFVNIGDRYEDKKVQLKPNFHVPSDGTVVEL